VKDFVESVNRLFEIIKTLSLDVSESSLKESAVLLVNSGRAVLHSPEDDDVISLFYFSLFCLTPLFSFSLPFQF
jgi:hypothetical protein